MTTLLRDEIGVGAAVLDSQANHRGTTGLLREARFSDLVDAHQHPARPAWLGHDDAGGGNIWAVKQGSTLAEHFGALESIAGLRVNGRPFTVSEFDVNPPTTSTASRSRCSRRWPCTRGGPASRSTRG